MQPVAVAGLLHERDQLLDEERVAAAAFEQELDGLGRRPRRRTARARARRWSRGRAGRGAARARCACPARASTARRGPGRVVATSTNGRSCRRASMRLQSSSASSLAQCRSESVSTSGAVAVSASKNAIVERSASSRARVGSTPGRVDAVHQVEEALDHALGSRAPRAGSSSALRDACDDAGAQVDRRRRRRRRRCRRVARAAQRFGDGDEHVGVAVRHALAGEHLGAEVARGAHARARSRAGSCRRPPRPRAARGAPGCCRAAIATTCSSVATSESRPRSGACSRARRRPGGAGASIARYDSTGSSRPRRPCGPSES